MDDQPVCVVIGVGPGNGESLVRKFAHEGYRVAALARDRDRLEELLGDLEAVTLYSCDATDAEQVREVFDRIGDELGGVHTLLYNAGSGTWGGLLEVSPDQLEQAWRVNTSGLFLAARQVIPAMVEAGDGVIGVTGATASWRGKPNTTAFAQAKASQRILAESMARQFGPEGVHVFYYIVDGVIDTPRTREMMSDKPDDFFLDPDDIAESVYAAANQPRSAWTFEFDLRPYGEEW